MSELPEYVIQQLRDVAATVCRDIVYTKKSSGAGSNSQVQLIEKAFHGSEGYASVMEAVLSGKGDYEPLYNKLPLENNREGNEFRTDGHMLELQEAHHLKTGTRFIVHEGGFDLMKMVSNRDGTQIKGRALDERARDVIATYKFALKYYKEYAGTIDPANPSGLKFEDMVAYVREKMFIHFRGAIKFKLAKGKPERTLADMKENWMFCGFFCFLLFGPMPLSGKTLTCLADSEDKVAKKSRHQLRKEEAEARNKERLAGAGGYVPPSYARGVSLKDKQNVAMIASNDHQFRLKNIRDLHLAYNQEQLACLQELKSYSELEENPDHLTEEMQNKLVELKSTSLNRLAEIKEKKRKLDEEGEELRNKKTPAQVSEYYNQVGNFQQAVPVTVDKSNSNDEEVSVVTTPPTASPDASSPNTSNSE